MVMVHLDARRDGVDVPEQHRGHPALALNLSRAFRLDVFEVGPFSVAASLSFQGEIYQCVIPYGAIFSMTSKADGQSRIFADAVPPEVQILADEEGEEESAAPEAEEPMVDDGATARAADSGDSAGSGPFLRLVD